MCSIVQGFGPLFFISLTAKKSTFNDIDNFADQTEEENLDFESGLEPWKLVNFEIVNTSGHNG